MKRRDFIGMTGLAGLALTTGMPSIGWAQEAGRYEGPLYLSVHAAGGWDPTSFCDPKGVDDLDRPNPINHYLSSDIRRPMGANGQPEDSPIRWAPFARNDAFFQRHWQRLLVVNGVDTSTNNHQSGTRFVNSGRLDEGHPSFTAMVAAQHGVHLPLGFITHGGYDITRGTVSRTRVNNLDALRRIAFPLRLNDDYDLMAESSFARVLRFHDARRRRQLAKQKLPRLRDSIQKMIDSRGAENEMASLVEVLPDLGQFNTVIGRQAAVAIAGYRAGMTVSANLAIGGFDTHANHDATQATAIGNLTDGLTELWDEVERHGLAERVVVVISSDFGRTPGYNEGNGKDHWPVTSMLAFGAGITGNRVVGLSDDGHRALPVNSQTFQGDANGVVITPGHVHSALRSMAGITNEDLLQNYPIQGDILPILTG